ncbi:MAG: hypothetical protein HQL47_02915 [Gammaproteobacteria bacterium]|nr:hypothetical protein [Gammaproteobacteria bacterium]
MTEPSTNPWKEPMRAMSDLWQKHIGSRINPATGEEEAEAAGTIAIPVEDMGSGMLNALKTGLSPITAFGSYSIKGVQYVAQDSAELVMKGVSKAKDLAAARKGDAGCDSCTTGCGNENAEEAAVSSTESAEKPQA